MRSKRRFSFAMPYKYNFKPRHLLSRYSYNNIVRIHRIYCKSVSKSDKRFFLDDSESNHLIKALRLKENSQVEVFDGNGNSCLCKIIKYSSKLCELEKLGDLKFDHQPKNILSVVIPLIKRTNFNFMIQKLTEIGVNNFMIYKADLIDQSIAKKDLSKIIAKVNEIAVNVCKQCGNNFLPSFSYFSSLVNALKDIQSSNQIYCFDTEAESYFDQQEIGNNSVTIITGPESGFSEKELVELTSMQEIKMRYLGENILRAETAPIVVSSVIKNHFGRI